MPEDMTKESDLGSLVKSLQGADVQQIAECLSGVAPGELERLRQYAGATSVEGVTAETEVEGVTTEMEAQGSAQ